MKLVTILKREYTTRVMKKSFIIMTILMPIIFAALMVLPAIIVLASDKMADKQNIAVIDETEIFTGKFDETDATAFVYKNDSDVEEMKKLIDEGIFDAVLHIPATTMNVPVNARLYSKDKIPMSTTANITTMMEKELEHQKLMALGIDPEIVKSTRTTVNVATIRIDEEEEHESFDDLSAGLGLISGLIIYTVIFIFGGMVVKGIVEEKNNRIVEIMMSSVKPFEMMMGKILGIALVGLTQFAIWIILTAVLYFIFSIFTVAPAVMGNGELVQQMAGDASTQEIITSVNDVVSSINFPAIITGFFIFFIGGYFLYAAMFAAIGSISDSEADNQQFSIVVSAPLIICIIMFGSIINMPDGNLALWLSMIPFTSPIVMMMRIPFGVPYWQVAVSAVILFATFVLITWMSAKIYRTGILMYGKKLTWKELWKWIRK